MTKKEELMNGLIMILLRYGIEPDTAKSEISILLDKYSISEAKTDLVIYDQMSNEALIQRFLISKKVKGLLDRSLKYYASELRRWDDAIQKSFIEMQPDDIRLRMAKRQLQDKVSATTINNEFRALSSFCTWMRDEMIRPDNPAIRVGRMKERKQKKVAFTNLEIEKMRTAITNARYKALFEILLSTGCRANEIVQIKISEIDNGKVILHGKGNKERMAFLNAKAIVAIEQYLSERKDGSVWLFPREKGVGKEKAEWLRKYGEMWYIHPETVVETEHMSRETPNGIVKAIGKKAGVAHVHTHKFRRTCATMALSRGMPLLQVSKMLGHESLQTTEIYIDLNEDELEHAHEKYVV